MRAGNRLLRLHYFNGIGYPGAETILGLGQRLVGKADITLRNRDKLLGGLHIEQRSSNVGIDLRAKILSAIAGLFQACVCLEYFAADPAAFKNGYGQCSAHVKYAVRACSGDGARQSVVAVDPKRG